ncbi:hypothetical protein KI387_001216, partial [Taxus chinensis]
MVKVDEVYLASDELDVGVRSMVDGDVDVDMIGVEIGKSVCGIVDIGMISKEEVYGVVDG